MIPICLLVEAIAVEVCSRLIVDKMFQLSGGGKARPAASKGIKSSLRAEAEAS
jgi:hypothetical protein